MTVEELRKLWPKVSIRRAEWAPDSTFMLLGDINGHTITARKSDATRWWSRENAACDALDWELGYARKLLNGEG